jgi:peptide-methionine (S)-S-oxide reductase
MSIETITLGAGCFWCVENIFSRIKGVQTIVSGYANGDIANPSYEQVSTGKTNYAEVIQLTFDKEQLSLEQLLTVFFTIHDPTTLNRQGDDVGSQYRSTILFHNEEQRIVAAEKIAQLTSDNIFENAIVTSIKPVDNFYSAESYHQDYYDNHPDNQYCQLVVARKIQKFLQNFSYLLKDAA